MRVLLGASNPYFPQHYGGIESHTDQLARGLIDRGHEVIVLANLASGDRVWARSRLKKALFGSVRSGERFNGYPLYRDWDLSSRIDELTDAFKPDVIVGNGGANIDAFFTRKTTQIPVIAHLHGLPPVDRARLLYHAGVRSYVCCSEFVRAKLVDRLLPDERVSAPVIYNAFDRQKYFASSSGTHVTLINPVREKGVEMAIALARSFPDIPFLFVKGWLRTKRQTREIEERIASLRNVRLVDATLDVRPIYATTRVLLVPSQCAEGAGRVIVEAQINGIPVLASNRGGTAEMLGNGGVLLSPDDFGSWAKTLSDIWHDDAVWREMSESARLNAMRSEFSIEGMLDAYELLLSSCVGGLPHSPMPPPSHTRVARKLTLVSD